MLTHVDLLLNSRLRNCLQTILELKEEMNGLSFDLIFFDEISVIRNFLRQIDDMSLCEDDVRRIEGATEQLLRELNGVFDKSAKLSADRGNFRLQ
ncbi:MAG: hypothetical protein LBV80_04775 [Deltaproteobacteria bacterium]|jgi:hypothetical protein|nr:hypothetical protein [Deltaproteobacteria bacterium]